MAFQNPIDGKLNLPYVRKERSGERQAEQGGGESRGTDRGQVKEGGGRAEEERREYLSTT
jgi:hypothetical protein